MRLLPGGRVRQVLSLAACGALVASTTTACFADASAMPTVRDFLIAWQVGNYKAAAKHTVGADEQTVATALSQISDQLDAASMKLGLGVPGAKKAIARKGTDAEARFPVKIDLGENGEPLSYTGQMHLKQLNGKWKVLWSPSIIHPNLGDGQRLAVVTDSPPRADIQNFNGRSVLRRVPAEAVGVLPGQLTDPQKTIAQLAEATKIDGRTLDADRLLGRVRSAPPSAFLPLVTLQSSENAALLTRLRTIPGLQFKKVTVQSPAIAPELVGSLGPATADRLQAVGAPYQPGDTIGISGIQLLHQRRLAGTPTVKVVVQDPAGTRQEVLADRKGRQGPQSVRTSLDDFIQRRAQKALTGLRVPASMVVIRAASGEVAAAANHRTGGRNLALEGRYPPGLTFGIVSSEALFQAGMREEEPTECPASTTVGGQNFATAAAHPKNTYQYNFAYSCATTLAMLSSRIDGNALIQAAAKFGFGKDWGLSVPAFSGSVTPPANDAEKASLAIGQSKVLASPLGMALTAGAVASGTWRPPLILLSPQDRQSLQPRYLEPVPGQSLKRLMQRSVKEGTASDAKLAGSFPVYGVTATVNYTEAGKPKTVSWFVGFRAEFAFAVAIEGNVPAGKIVARLLKGR